MVAPSSVPVDHGLDAAGSANDRDLLRFITCGSVDDGKSTLIGRLLFDTDGLTEDQLTALKSDSLRSGTQGGALDLALALDGLSAEREQGITIDVAYRFFSTTRRAFIVADTPGHEQYTPNMATGASTADTAVLLVDARKGLLRQTRRHSLIVSALGIRHVIVAVNKMDLVSWSHEAFEAIAAEYHAFAANLGFQTIQAIPLSAKSGDNVSRRSAAASWYEGPALLSALETIDLAPTRATGAFRLPVQWVNRPNAGFRGFAGLVVGGPVRAGDRVKVLPSGEETRIDRIVTFDGDLAVAVPGQSVTLTLADEVDVSRGAVIATAAAPPAAVRRIEARVFWMTKAPLATGGTYFVRIGTETVTAEVERIAGRVNLDTGIPEPANAIGPNDLGSVSLLFDRLAVAEAYRENPDLGSLILIDRESFATVGLGLVEPDRGGGIGETSDGAAKVDRNRGWSPDLACWLPSSFAAPWRSALKAATWRVAGTVLTVVAAWWLTGDMRIALALGLFEILVKSILQFGHERLWTHLAFGLAWGRENNRST